MFGKSMKSPQELLAVKMDTSVFNPNVTKIFKKICLGGGEINSIKITTPQQALVVKTLSRELDFSSHSNT